MTPMPYVVEHSGLGYRLEFTDEPPNVHALEMGVPAREDLLNEGTWLVLGFAVWSGPDREAVDVALRIARDKPEISVGVRPFDEHAELVAWCSAPERGRTPIWVLLVEGQQMGALVGAVYRDEVQEFIDETLPAGNSLCERELTLREGVDRTAAVIS